MAVINPGTGTPVKPAKLKKACQKKMIVAVLLLLFEVFITISQVVLGVWVHISVENVEAGAFWAPVLLLLGALVSLEGIMFHFGRQKTLAMGVMLQVMGVFMALVGAVLDSVVASMIHKVDFGRCSYSETGLANCTGGELSCDHAVQLSFPKSCFCCYLTKERMSPCYFRAVSLFEPPSAYGGVESCDYVSGHYLGFLWASASLCVLCCFFGIMAALATYSYRNIIKPRPTSIGISTNVTTPMLQHRTEIREVREITANWTAGSSGRQPTLDIPIPAPRNSLGRSAGRRALLALPAPEESTTPTTPDCSSSIPPQKKKKRRAPGIPGSQPSSSVESSPCRSVATDLVVRPKRESVTRTVRSLDRRNLPDRSSSSLSPERRPNSVDSGQMLSSSPRKFRDRDMHSREERPRSLCNIPQGQAQDGVRESEQQENIDLERPSSSSGHRSSPSRGPPNSSASGRERYLLSAAETTSQDASADSEGLPSYASCTGYSPNRSSNSRGASSLRNSSSPNASSTTSNTDSSRTLSDAACVTNTPSNTSSSGGASRGEFPEEVVVRKKRKSHKGPAPQPPTQQMQLQACRAPVSSLSPIPLSPPPPFSSDAHPPSPPTSPPPFTTSSPHHCSHVQPHQYTHPPPAPHQPVTNIHVTFTAPPAMGPAPMSMPLNQPHGYTFQSHPSAPYL